MQKFVSDVLENISPILHSLPFDSLLYAKQETNISSILSSYGNQMIGNTISEYYRTEYSKVDIGRIRNGILDFGCECKYLYTSDINEYGKIGGYGYPVGKTLKNLISNKGKQVNYVEYELLKAFEQIDNYTKSTQAKNNKLVLINLICAPYGTNGKYESNSGIKYFDANSNRSKFDATLIQKGEWKSLSNTVDARIKQFPTLTQIYTALNLKFEKVTPLRSLSGFDYYMITIAYEA